MISWRRYLPVVLGNYLARLGFALFLAWPFVRVLQASGLEQFPAGDRLLFQSGGLYLLEVVRLSSSELVSLGRGSLVLAIPLAAVLLLVRALTLEALSGTQPPPLGQLFSSALRRLPSFVLIAGVTLLAQVLTLGLFGVAAARLSDALGGSRAEPRGDIASALCIVLGVVLALLLGAAAELGRASVVQRGIRGLEALRQGLLLLRSRLLAVLARWGGPAALSLLLVAFAAWLTGLCDVSRPGALRPLAVFVLHQVVALGLVCLHAVWLRGALALSRPEPQPAAASR